MSRDDVEGGLDLKIAFSGKNEGSSRVGEWHHEMEKQGKSFAILLSP